MSSKSHVTTYRIRTPPSRKSSSHSSYSLPKERHDSLSHSHTLHAKGSRDSISSTPRHPISDEDVVIVVMGMTGSGKSTLINLIADEKVEVGHSLQSCTTEVQVASFSTSSGRPGYLIDTPGFDDTDRSDTEILKEIAAFLAKLYMRRIRVTGLVYVHRITDPRMQGSAVKNLKVFQRLCGAQCFPQVALVSTMWQMLQNSEAQAVGEEREAALRSNDAFWGAMDKGRSRTFRHFGGRESAMTIFRWFLGFQQKVVLNIQRELVDEELTLDQTEAGKFLQETSARVKENYEKEIRQLQRAIDDAHQERDTLTENELLLHREEVEAALGKVDQDSRDMHINIRQLEAEKAPEYAIRVEEMERQLALPAPSAHIATLQAQLAAAQEENNLLQQSCQQREHELRQHADALRRQDNAKARDQIARLKADLHRVQAQSRDKTDAFERLAERLQTERPSHNAASRVLEFMMRNFAAVFHSGYEDEDENDDPDPLRRRYAEDEGDEVGPGRLMLMPKLRRSVTADSVQPFIRRRGGGGGGGGGEGVGTSRYEM
jgi:GTP-binding protein EngB required for normal cell division